MRILLFLFFCIVCVFSFFLFFKSSDEDVYPVNLNKSHICACDGMILINYNGPKAQILWKDGSRSFYCEVKEAFYDYLDSIKSKRIKAFFVQDFSYLDWGSYIDKWILAKEVVYVIDSSKDGAMGITYVPFSKLDYANKFFLLYGGKMVKFDEIDLNILSISSALLKNRLIH